MKELKKEGIQVYHNLAIIVAIARNFAIGKNNELLFHLPNDLKRFKLITQGHSVIMGKNTFLSLPKGPLPYRRNIVITSTPGKKIESCETVHSLDEAIELVKDEDLAFVIGGGLIYRQVYPIAGRMYLTLIDKDFEADTFFPEIRFNDWIEIKREDLYDERNDFRYSYIDLVRKEII
jgi:dihydrofolate reductase